MKKLFQEPWFAVLVVCALIIFCADILYMLSSAVLFIDYVRLIR